MRDEIRDTRHLPRVLERGESRNESRSACDFQIIGEASETKQKKEGAFQRPLWLRVN